MNHRQTAVIVCTLKMVYGLQGDAEQVEVLVTHGADVNQTGHSGVAALHIAAMCGHHEVIYTTHMYCGLKPLTIKIKLINLCDYNS